MKASDWGNQKQVEQQLQRSLSRLTAQVERIANKYDTPQGITAAVSNLSESPAWLAFAEAQAARMTTLIALKNAANWREAAKLAGNSFKIFQGLKKEFQNNKEMKAVLYRNAQLIKSLPDDVSRHITKFTQRQTIRGLRASSMMAEIRKNAPELSEARVKLIARTETAKTQAAINEIRSTRLGYNWYIWRTVKDSRVRTSHGHMEGVICPFNSPPCPEKLAGVKGQKDCYNPGGTYNCRCFSESLIALSQIKWPAKVYLDGRIQRMSQSQFLRVTGAKFYE